MKWPAFRLGTPGDLQAVAALRQLTPGISWLAQRVGFLRFSTTSAGVPCYVLREGAFAQARRMDGQPFTKPDGSTYKTWNLKGSQGRWFGYQMLKQKPAAPVLIVEGVIAWLEAARAISGSEHLSMDAFGRRQC